MLLSQTKLATCKASSSYLFLQMDPDISNNNPELGIRRDTPESFIQAASHSIPYLKA